VLFPIDAHHLRRANQITLYPEEKWVDSNRILTYTCGDIC
jgi:hypothetical protein